MPPRSRTGDLAGTRVLHAAIGAMLAIEGDTTDVVDLSARRRK